jgi:hypothetical protein
MHFSPPQFEDLEQISDWVAHDPYHFHQGQPEWWLGVGALLAFRLMDDKGPLCYVRLDEEGGYVRIHTQFAPESVVSRRRLVVSMIQAVKCLIDFYQGKSGLIFNSTSPTLIAFMSKYLGFKPIGQDDYRLDFEG